MKTGVNEVSTVKNVFKGSGKGLYIANYKSSGFKRNSGLKPEQTEGELIVSGNSWKQVSQQYPSGQYSPDKLQMFSD